MSRAVQRAWFLGRRLGHALRRPQVASEPVWLVSEGGWKLHARVYVPRGAQGRLPAVLLVPGLGAPGAVLEGFSEPIHVAELGALGVVVMTVDLSGRGRSWGVEVYGGPEHQGDVRAALRHLSARLDVDSGRVGVVSLSLGCTAVAGALVDRRAPPVQFWIDWEGPCDREIITSGGTMMDPAMGHSLHDDAFWHPREAVRHVGRTGVPYLRYQSSRDHAQPGEVRHAVRMIGAAASGSLPWFQLNDHARGHVPSEPTWQPPGYRRARDWIVEQVRVLHGLP